MCGSVMDGCTDGHGHERTDVRMDGWADWQMGKVAYGQVEGRIDSSVMTNDNSWMLEGAQLSFRRKYLHSSFHIKTVKRANMKSVYLHGWLACGITAVAKQPMH